MSVPASFAAPRFVAYLRVSTDKQGRSGLRHAAATGGCIIGEHVKVESGRKQDRPQFAAALSSCRARRGELVIAKFDCLARNVHFAAALMASGVEFVASDMPAVNRLTVHTLAAVAEEEARMISARTKAALTAAKARGVKLGNPHLLARYPVLAARSGDAQQAEARRRTAAVLPYLE